MQTITRLLDGYRQFFDTYMRKERTFYQELTEKGQSPNVLVIACCDSRVDPALLTNASPGEMFVIRNIANIVPPFQADKQTYHGTSAALEFGIKFLKVEHVIVFGHSRCGGIQALMEGKDKDTSEHSFIWPWVRIAKKAKDWAVKHYPDLQKEALCDVCAQQSVINSLANLQTYPWLKERLDASNLQIHGWFFDLEKGLKTYDSATGGFDSVSI